MGISNRSHGKKSDKETQSPLLKLFKDMVQKEKHGDPEKTNLLKTKREKKKKKHSGSRSKSDHKTMESSCSEHRIPPYSGTQEMLNAELHPTRTHSVLPLQGEKRESWWFWGESCPQKPPSEDTCSCVSCALKKIISTDYACIGCLVLLFTISVIVAFLLVYKSIPCFIDKTESTRVDTDRPKRKIDGVNRLRWDHLGKNTLRKKWDSGEIKYGVPRSMDFQDLNNLVDADSDLFKIMDNEMMNEIQTSDRLREFYKKLIKTDAQIRNLKKNSEAVANNIEDIEDRYPTYPERAKRSLANFYNSRNLFQYKKHKKGKVHNVSIQKDKIVTEKNKNDKNINSKEEIKPITAMKDSKQNNTKGFRNKRFDNISKPEGILIEKKKFLIQYKPTDENTNRKSKCSHVPKESKSHESQLKHPFYQNTQRLDELLDKFFDKNLPEILADRFGWDGIFEKEKNKCKHPAIRVETPLGKETKLERVTEKTLVVKKKDKLKNNEKVSSLYDDKTEISTLRNDFDDLEFDGDRKREDSTTNDYGLLMSISTMMFSGNTNIKRTTYAPNLLLDRVPNARKLLQTDADDDMNEVLVKTHDIANEENRKKRMNEPTLEDTKSKLQINPASVLSPSWKGPMPLYPDELNTITKQEPVIVNKVATPVQSKYNLQADEEPIAENKLESPERSMDSEKYDNLVNRVETLDNKDSSLETDEFEADLNDMEYIEDYFRNKFDNLVELAQAYSDYGVLNGKKINTEKKVDDKIKLAGPDHRNKLSLSGLKEGFKSSIFGRPKKGNFLDIRSPSEGFRFEMQPTSSSREDNDLYRALQKHIKLANFKTIYTTPSVPVIDLTYTIRDNGVRPTKKVKQDGDDLVFSIGKGKRTLKSVECTENSGTTSDENEKDDGILSDEKKEDEVYSDQNIRNAFDGIIKYKREVDNASFTNDNNVASINAKLGIKKDSTRNNTEIDSKEVTNNTTKLANGTLSNIDMSLSDFFMLLSSWFSALDGVDINFNRNVTGNASSPNNTHTNIFNETVDIVYPAYDSDMIENIGHRSRVLLSVENYNDTVKIERKSDKDEEMVKANDLIDVKMNITNKPIAIKVNKTKSIVKRNADSNLIFWNDLYDDEYGVAVDHLDNSIRDKHSIGKTDFMKRPNEWFRSKVKKITDGIHKKAERLRKGSKIAALKAINNKGEATIESKSKQAIYKRISRKTTEDDPRQTKKTDFATLTANMKIICRKAAKDIERANKVNVREVSKDGKVASSLMQQLVRMMGDLVDYQVKQRTCRKLPPDLQTFLEWLTSSSSEPEPELVNSSSKMDEYPNIDFAKAIDKSEDHTLGMSSSEHDTPDSRSDCLGTLQAVQALMQQYEEMGEDEKSKMGGVKEYLENQLQYLQKQMPSNQDFSLYNTDSIRFRRAASTQTSPKPHRFNKKRKRRLKELFRNFIKKFDKYRNTTDQTTVTIEAKKINTNTVEEGTKKKDKVKAGLHKVTDSKSVKEKRNLRDVYYKALADSKKLTTIKNHGK